MFEFFRKYQKAFFLAIAIMVIGSFTFFGTYDAISREGKQPELTDAEKLIRFLNAENNACDDGVLENDFLKTQIADMLVERYADPIQGEIATRLEKAKRFKPYQHSQMPFISAAAVWDHFYPEVNQWLEEIKKEGNFSLLSKLYQAQAKCHPELLRKILMIQCQQMASLPQDPRLYSTDLALFGFHTPSDWFGRTFVDVVAQFILNAADAAERKGYSVTREEALGDLAYHFNTAMKNAGENKPNFTQYLQHLGFDEKSASETWRKVLLFRRYFQDAGNAVFTDRLPQKDLSEFAQQTAVVKAYSWPIRLANSEEIGQFTAYAKAVCPNFRNVLSVEEVEKNNPDLVETTYRVQVASIPKMQLALRAPLKEVWEWEMQNWKKLKEQFAFLPSVESRDERFSALEKLSLAQRNEVDKFVRLKLLEQNPAWVDEALASAEFKEKTFYVTKGDPVVILQNQYKDAVYRIQNLEKIEEKHILPFSKARMILPKEAKEGDKNPMAAFSEKAKTTLQKDPANQDWIQTGADPIVDQFRLIAREVEIQRTSREDWMKTLAFMMLPDQWSAIHVSDDGELSFFYLQQKKISEAPILEQLTANKELIAADAQRYLAMRLMEASKHKIVIHKERDE